MTAKIQVFDAGGARQSLDGAWQQDGSWRPAQSAELTVAGGDVSMANPVPMIDASLGWLVKGTGAGAQANAAKTGVTGKTHVVKRITGGFDNLPNGAAPLVTLTDATAGVLGIWPVAGKTFEITFDDGVPITLGATVTASLAADPSGANGYVNLHGRTQ